MTVAPAHRRAPTISDVAARAGVSTATVSKVINARHGVAESTALRVRRAIEGMGYEPSLAARRLRGGQTRVVGVLFAELDAWAGEVLKGVSSAAEGSGYGLLAFSGGRGPGASGWEHRALTMLGETLIDGAILLASGQEAIPGYLPVVAVALPQPRGALGRPVDAGRGAPSAEPRALGAAALAQLLTLIADGGEDAGEDDDEPARRRP